MSSVLDGYRLLHDGALALAEVERSGIYIDVDYCREKIAWIDEQESRTDRRLRTSALGHAWTSRFGTGANWDSGPQLQAVLYADLGVKPFKQTDTGLDSVDEESLLQTGVDGIAHLLRRRGLKKVGDVLRQFLRYQIDGVLHPNFHLHTVVTYRGSCSAPNLQNVPHRDREQMLLCRRAIVPSPGHVLLEIDYSGIEVAVAAMYHRDPTMLGYLGDPASDMHADAAKRLFFLSGANSELKQHGWFKDVLRQAGKNSFIFPQFYGDWYESCAQNVACGWCKLPRIGDWADDDGVMMDGCTVASHLRSHNIGGLADFIEHVRGVENWLWKERFPVYAQWKRDWYGRYQRRGNFRMKTGFVCSGVMDRKQSVNYPVQGVAFHLLLKSLSLVVQRIRGWRSRVIGQIHDSLLVDADPGEVSALVDMVRHIASDELPALWDWIIVPLRIESMVSEVNGSWAQMKVVE